VWRGHSNGGSTSPIERMRPPTASTRLLPLRFADAFESFEPVANDVQPKTMDKMKKGALMSETEWVHAFVARLRGLGATTSHEHLAAKAACLWPLIGDVDPEAVAKQEFKGWVLPMSRP